MLETWPVLVQPGLENVSGRIVIDPRREGMRNEIKKNTKKTNAGLSIENDLASPLSHTL